MASIEGPPPPPPEAEPLLIPKPGLPIIIGERGPKPSAVETGVDGEEESCGGGETEGGEEESDNEARPEGEEESAMEGEGEGEGEGEDEGD